MQKHFSLANIVLAAIVAVSSVPAFGQSASCACTTPHPAFGVPTGQITAVNGQVLVSQPTGLTPAAIGAGLSPGSQILLGPNASAIVAFGSCDLNLDANSALTVIDTGADICLRVEGTGQQASGPHQSINPLILGGIAGAAGIAAIAGSTGDGGFALGGGDDPVSR